MSGIVDEIVTKFNQTGACEIDINNLIKYWNNSFILSQWNEEFTLVKYKNKSFRVREFKIQIDGKTANELIKQLGLMQGKSELFASGSTWISPRILYLPIKKQWFDMIASGEKKAEYRDIKPYYDSRFMRTFHIIRFKNGYRRNAPVMDVECTELNIGYGLPKWGAENKISYILTLGKILNNSNDNRRKQIMSNKCKQLLANVVR